MHLFYVTFSVVYVALSAICFVSFRTILRETYDRSVPLMMIPNELKRVEYITQQRKEFINIKQVYFFVF